MHLDKFSNPVFTEEDIFNALYKGHSLTSNMIVESNPNIKQLEEIGNIKFAEPYPTDLAINIEEYDLACQQNWFMPDEYKTLDIEAWIWEQTPPWNPQHTRVAEELQEYRARNMLDLLRWLKYFVDTCNSKNVLWGVGRGSSVASYVLYLIGVHSVDSIKYNLDWQEFLR
jgi:DNA polymerase III alpha subunit